MNLINTSISSSTTSSSTTAPPPNLAEALAAVASWTDLSAQRRRDLRSAVSCAFEIAKPHALVLSCAKLNELLYRKPPAAYGLAQKQFANIVSALRYILRRLGLHSDASVKGRDGLTAAWLALTEMMPTRERQFGIIRFAKFCSASGIAPGHVRQSCLVDFESWLRDWTITDDVSGLVRRTAHNWRWAAAHVDGWPQVKLEREASRDWYSLPLAAYGAGFEAEAEAYLARRSGASASLMEEIDITDLNAAERAGPRRPLKPRSISTMRDNIRISAAALVLSPDGMQPAEITGLSCFVQPVQNAARILDFHWKRAGQKPTQRLVGIADLLLQIARYHARSSDKDIELIERLRRKVRPPAQTSMTDKNRQRLITLLAPRNQAMLLHFPDELLRRAANPDLPPRQAARIAMFAIALEILLVCPLRRENLAELRIDSHLRRADPTRPLITDMFIPGDQVKNEQSIEWPIATDTAKRLRDYLDRYRPILAEADNVFLFPGTGVKPKSAHDLGVQLSELVEREIGAEFNVHLMRHFAVVTFLNANPGQYEIVRRVLGHRSLSTTLRFYAGLEADIAARKFSEALAEGRAESRAAAEAQFAPTRQASHRIRQEPYA